jgi:tRNA(Ile)-lysidine synthase
MLITQKVSNEVLLFIKSNIKLGSNIILGCSGGADSTALAIVMSNVVSKYSLNIQLNYINHKLRDNKSILEEKKFVRQLAKKLNFSYSYSDISKSEFDRIHDSSLENTARILRYQKLSNNAQKFNSNIILLGHTANDSAETILFNIIRGSGLKGIEGIRKIISKKINDNQFKILRPVIDIKKDITEKICTENDTNPIFDKSNDDYKFTRNKIRKEIIPGLEAINPKVINALIKLGNIAKIKNSSEEGYVSYFYSNLVSEHNNNYKIKDVIIFKVLPESIRKEIIKIIIEKNSNHIQINNEHIYKIDELLCSEGNKYYDLPNNIKFAKEYNMANFEIKTQM